MAIVNAPMWGHPTHPLIQESVIPALMVAAVAQEEAVVGAEAVAAMVAADRLPTIPVAQAAVEEAEAQVVAVNAHNVRPKCPAAVQSP